jgi:hypothetical protein
MSVDTSSSTGSSELPRLARWLESLGQGFSESVAKDDPILKEHFEWTKRAAQEVRKCIGGVAQISIIAPVESVGLRGAMDEAVEQHKSMLSPDWKQDQAETSRLPRKPTQGGDKGEAYAWHCTYPRYGHLTLRREEMEQAAKDGAQIISLYATPQPLGPAYPIQDPLVGLDGRLDRLLLTAIDNGRFVLSTESAKNIVGIVRAWLRSKGVAIPSTQRDGEAE